MKLADNLFLPSKNKRNDVGISLILFHLSDINTGNSSFIEDIGIKYDWIDSSYSNDERSNQEIINSLEILKIKL